MEASRSEPGMCVRASVDGLAAVDMTPEEQGRGA